MTTLYPCMYVGWATENEECVPAEFKVNIRISQGKFLVGVDHNFLYSIEILTHIFFIYDTSTLNPALLVALFTLNLAALI